MAAPMPRLAPVTTATLPVRSNEVDGCMPCLYTAPGRLGNESAAWSGIRARNGQCVAAGCVRVRLFLVLVLVVLAVALTGLRVDSLAVVALVPRTRRLAVARGFSGTTGA